MDSNEKVIVIGICSHYGMDGQNIVYKLYNDGMVTISKDDKDFEVLCGEDIYDSPVIGNCKNCGREIRESDDYYFSKKDNWVMCKFEEDCKK